MNLEAMKPKKITRIPNNNNDNYVYERKLDGGNGFIVKRKGKTKIFHNHNKTPQNYRYPLLCQECDRFLKDGIYQGELCVFQNGFSDFDLFQKRQVEHSFKIEIRSERYPVKVMIHDILHENGNDVRNCCLSERKNMVEHNVKQGEHIGIVPFFDNPDKLLFQQKNLEGIVIKEKDSVYLSGKRQGYKFRFNQEKKITCVDYENHPMGIVMETDGGKRVNLAGKRSEKAKQEIDNRGKVNVEISFNGETDKGFRFCSVKRVLI